MRAASRTIALSTFLVTGLLAAVATPIRGQHSGDVETVAPEKVLAGMDWLAGTWSGDMWGGRFVAYYSTPEGGRILGHSRLLKEGKEVFYEFEMFEPREQTLHMQPFPGGKRVDGFTLRELDPNARKATFANPEKDYPTRIVYQRVADDALVITLDDPHGDSDKVERFDLRAAVPSAAAPYSPPGAR